MAGDVFLYFLSKKLYIDITYKNHSGFISCFILQFIELKDPIFILKDSDLVIECQKAYIEPDFSKLVRENKIILKCTLKNASFLNIKEKVKNQKDLFIFFDENSASLFDEFSNALYDNIHTQLVIFDDSVRFPSYVAHNEDIKLYAFGSATKRGDLDISLKIFLSPKIIRQLPKELALLLRQEIGGWASYYMHIESKHDKSFLKIDSDRFRLDFKQIETR